MTEAFEESRGTLFGIAYRMLGNVADAEDVVQDAWLRWDAVTTPVDSPKAYLARTVTNLCLNRLRSGAATRETYVGPWLPEPLLAVRDSTEDVEVAESVSLGMMVVMESLSPLERAVFVLREVFGFNFEEIAEMLGRSPAAVRQVGHRARSHVQSRRPRFETSEEANKQVTDEFLAACMGGDINRMMEMLAPDVTAWTDGGGKVRAALRPVYGPGNVSRFIIGSLNSQKGADIETHPAQVNGQPGVIITADGILDSVVSCDVEDGRVVAIWVVRNPDKLRRIEAEAFLAE